MIKAKGKTTEVLFSKDGEKGAVSVQAHYNMLILQELTTDKKVADRLSIVDGDIKDLPKVILDFQTTKSIDVVIEILNRIRQNIKRGHGMSFAEAC
jgi:hypothetical protein